MIHRIYHKELDLKDTTDIVKSTSYLETHFETNGNGKILNKLYDKRDELSFSELSTFLSSVATSFQHMRMEYSYSYVMP